jgi:hypothetical protein
MSRNSNALTILTLGAALACGGGEAAEDEEARDLSMPPAESLAVLSDRPQAEERRPPATTQPQSQPRPQPQAQPPRQSRPATPPAPLTLPAGAVIELAATDTISSKTHNAGDPVTATVNADINDARGRLVVPAGAVFRGVIAEIKPAGSPGGVGTLRLAFDAVSFGGRTYAAVAESDSLGTETQGRGVSGGDAAKVGVGAAAGAIAGRIIGKDTKGAVIGGVVGAAAGAGVAAATKDQDIVLPAGGRIRLVLQQEMVLAPIG